MRSSPRLTPYGKAVKKRLIDKDMTQTELASAIGCEKQYLQKILTGVRSGQKYRDKISEVLEMERVS